MPTPSSNPPPELPPRTHSSSCPDEARSSNNNPAWRPDTQHDDGPEMNVDHDAVVMPTSTLSPEPTSVGTLTASGAEMGHDATDTDLRSRSTTESPRPDSRSGIEPLGSDRAGTPASTSAEQMQSQAQAIKPPDGTDDEVLVMARGRSVRARSDAPRHGTSYGFVPSTSIGADSDKLDSGVLAGGGIEKDGYALSMGYDFSNVRIMPSSPSSFLRPGSRFVGTQQSERQVYEVQVEIKYVDLRESFLCGYLKIQGLTEDNPTLTTYFEGEIIGSKYGFITQHPSWGATEKIDLNHWGKFSAFRQYAKQVRKGPVVIPNLAQRENVFMRWKEHFLVPDHRVRTINGASFEGFYYICFNQKEGGVNGIYFHSKSERFQQLELRHVEDKGCFGALEFR
ncbi:vacuolar import and degradation protein-domain-containing protein [Xylariaceae sp. FL0662B]|nr:vacuolar import and degradation protein-domain-containing protein [Xylariaceae sp. FL0662B]